MKYGNSNNQLNPCVDMQVLYRNVCRIDGLFDSVQFDLQDCDKLVALKEVSQRENLSCHKPSRIVTSALLS